MSSERRIRNPNTRRPNDEEHQTKDQRRGRLRDRPTQSRILNHRHKCYSDSRVLGILFDDLSVNRIAEKLYAIGFDRLSTYILDYIRHLHKSINLGFEVSYSPEVVIDWLF